MANTANRLHNYWSNVVDKTIVMFGRTFSNRYAQLVRPLTAAERQRLAGSIRRRGIMESIKHDEDDNILDGWHRLEIADEMGLAEVPMKLMLGLTESDKRAVALSLNAARRQLSDTELEELVASFLKKDPKQSDRKIAEETKTSHSKVAEVREQLEEKKEIPKVDETQRQAADGGKAPQKDKPPKERKKKDKTQTPTEQQGDVVQVPAHLADAFQEAVRLETMAKSLSSLQSYLKNSLMPWNKYLRASEALEAAAQLEKLLRDCIPATICPACAGNACKECRNQGWVPAWREEEILREIKTQKT